MKKVTEIEIDGELVSQGTEIKVRHSAPSVRDGFKAQFWRALINDNGELLEITVFGSPGSIAPAMRTFKPERIERIIPRRPRTRSRKEPLPQAPTSTRTRPRRKQQRSG